MSNPDLRPITEEERRLAQQEWDQGESLSALLPYTAPDGFYVTMIDAECLACGKPINPDRVRVSRVTHPNGVDEWRSIGLCCRTVTHFLWRFRPDGGFQALTGHTWKTFSTSHPPPPAWRNIIGKLRRHIKTLLGNGKR